MHSDPVTMLKKISMLLDGYQMVDDQGNLVKEIPGLSQIARSNSNFLAVLKELLVRKSVFTEEELDDAMNEIIIEPAKVEMAKQMRDMKESMCPKICEKYDSCELIPIQCPTARGDDRKIATPR